MSVTIELEVEHIGYLQDIVRLFETQFDYETSTNPSKVGGRRAADLALLTPPEQDPKLIAKQHR